MVGEWQVLEEEAANIDETFQDLVPSEDNDLPTTSLRGRTISR